MTDRRERIWCANCNKYHADGDPIEKVITERMIAVRCMRHAVWACRKLIIGILRARSK